MARDSRLADHAEVQYWVYKRHRDLSRRERHILKMRYGMGYLRDWTYAEIAKEVGLSPVRVREIEDAAVWRMRYTAPPVLKLPTRRGRPPST